MRMVLPNGMGEEADLNFRWVNPKALKIRHKWPKFMISSLMMTELDVYQDSDGRDVQTYDRGHPVYDSMGANAAHMAEGGESIYSEGIFYFERNMKSNYEEKLFELISTNGDKGSLLQIKFFEATDESTTFSSPIQKVARTINYSKSSRDPTRNTSPRRPAPKRDLPLDDESPSGGGTSKHKPTNDSFFSNLQPRFW